MIKRIHIKGFRSIKDAALELNPINILIGANGSGKSNLISFLRLLRAIADQKLQLTIAKSGRAHSNLFFGPKQTKQISAILEFEFANRDSVYEFELAYGEDDSFFFSLERFQSSQEDSGENAYFSVRGPGHVESKLGDTEKITTEIELRPRDYFRQCLRYQFHDTTVESRIRQSCYVNHNRSLESDGGNLPAVLYRFRQHLPGVYRRILSTIQTIVPDFDDFVLEPSPENSNELFLNWQKKGWDGYLFGPHQMSDGTLRAIALITLLMQPDGELPKLIAIDEPELGLHPAALEIIANLISSLQRTTQVIVATQSQQLINYFRTEDIVVTESESGITSFRRLNPEELSHWLDDYSLGDLWEMNVIGGGPLH